MNASRTRIVFGTLPLLVLAAALANARTNELINNERNMVASFSRKWFEPSRISACFISRQALACGSDETRRNPERKDITNL